MRQVHLPAAICTRWLVQSQPVVTLPSKVSHPISQSPFIKPASTKSAPLSNQAGQLNPEQQRAVRHISGPLLVLAGAGSGKTSVITRKVAYLIEKGVSPENILLLTFTNRAAMEMIERARELSGGSVGSLWSGTFHHIGNRTLRSFADRLGYTRDFGILDQQDSRELIKACMPKKTKGASKTVMPKDRFPKASIVQATISFSYNTGKTIAKVLSEKYPYFAKHSEQIDKIKLQYEKKKKESLFSYADDTDDPDRNQNDKRWFAISANIGDWE